uniref:Rx N-terminal domain-containing protein n=1 Tax=Leersia perrieri TaxID=77586 RepID=A0A0D9VFD3_9ORYZ
MEASMSRTARRVSLLGRVAVPFQDVAPVDYPADGQIQQKGARGDIMFIKAELESIQAALEKLFEVQVTDSLVKIWERDVREQSYDIEDVIDTFMIHIENHLLTKPHGLKGFMKGSLSLLTRAMIRHRIATDIKRIKKLVSEASARRDRYKIDNIVAAAKTKTTIDPRLVGIYREALVGISGPKEELTKLLMESEGTSKNKLKVISIVGVGGLGKTTLANVIYQHLKGQFDCDAFVSVSLKPDLKKILSSIFRQFSGQGNALTETWCTEEIINKIRDEINDKRWISEGFIPGEDVDTLYEQGGNYFNELVNRSMIQPAYIDSHGRVHACRVHDMVLDLITSLSDEINFVTSLRGQQSTCQSNKVRRLCLQNSMYDHTIRQETMKWSRVRSLIVFPDATNLLPSLSRFCILRVLDLEGCQDLKSRQFKYICGLFHLRSLILKGTNISSLPNKIGNLSCLHTLDIRHTIITELPLTVVHLRKLVHLLIDASVKLPDGIGNMKCLQEISLVGISRSPNFLKELGCLTELRKLQISESTGAWHKGYEKTLIDSLRNLHKIHHLYIHGCELSTEFISNIRCFSQHLRYISCGQLSILPRWINSSLLCLSTIDLILNVLRQYDLQCLGALQFLHCLRLKVLKIEPERLVVSTEHAKFHNLAEFSFTTSAMGLIFMQYSMPRLENLELGFNVRQTKGFDIGLEHLSSLKDVTVRIDCRDSSTSEVQNADAAIRRILYMNSNQPNIHVIRHYEQNLIRDEVKVQKEAVEEKELLENKIGSWGGNGGVTCDIKVPPKHL